MNRKRTVFFIDAENLFYIQKGLGWEIDYEKLYNFFAEKAYIYNAFYYTAVDPSDEKSYKEKSLFLNNLAPIGYTVRKKPLKIIKTDTGILKKGNMDIELVVDMFTTKDLYDTVILFSGDSDFTRALELLRTHGKEIIVISAMGFVSKELINAADKYIDMSKLQKHVEKTPSAKEKSPQKKHIPKKNSSKPSAPQKKEPEKSDSTSDDKKPVEKKPTRRTRKRNTAAKKKSEETKK